jgi:hypothetical protein
VDPTVIIERAIVAHGGAAKLESTSKVRRVVKGVAFVGSDRIKVETVRRIVSDGERVNSTSRTQFPEGEYNDTIVYDGRHGWHVRNSQTSDCTESEIRALKTAEYHNKVKNLVPILKDKRFTLSFAGSTTEGKENYLRVMVAAKGYPDAELFFSEKTALLGRMKTTIKNDENLTVAIEYVYSEYKSVQGVQVAMKRQVFEDGQVRTEEELSEIEFPEKIDQRLFEKPR